MPTTHHSEAALERRREKFDYVRTFPGLLAAWDQAVGKRVAQVETVGEWQLVLFEDGCFLIGALSAIRDDALFGTLQEFRNHLAAQHGSALAELDRRAALEAEAMRLARMEKVLGAVETNLPQIPELIRELRRLLDQAEG